MADPVSHDAIIAQTERYVLPLYKRTPLALVGGSGVWLDAADGRRYLDGLAGIAVNALGYGDSDVVAAIQQAASGLLHTSNLYYTAPAARLAERLVGLTPWASRAFFCNSGAEAIEAALKFARRYAHNQAPGAKFGLVSCTDSFHGRTMGALSVTSREGYRTPFEPLVPGGVVFAPQQRRRRDRRDRHARHGGGDSGTHPGRGRRPSGHEPVFAGAARPLRRD
jgi:acetylornithine/N-succinyldiaminopimelate aminotransferase